MFVSAHTLKSLRDIRKGKSAIDWKRQFSRLKMRTQVA
jgi:hypothetical protein